MAAEMIAYECPRVTPAAPFVIITDEHASPLSLRIAAALSSQSSNGSNDVDSADAIKSDRSSTAVSSSRSRRRAVTPRGTRAAASMTRSRQPVAPQGLSTPAATSASSVVNPGEPSADRTNNPAAAAASEGDEGHHQQQVQYHWVHPSQQQLEHERRYHLARFHDAGSRVLGLVLITWTLSHGVLLVQLPRGSSLGVFAVTCTFMGDNGGLLAGRLLGRTRAVRRLSPNKTLEGYIGQVMLAALTAGVWDSAHRMIYSGLPWCWHAAAVGGGDATVITAAGMTNWQTILLGAMIGAFGAVGDLTESYIKRVHQLVGAACHSYSVCGVSCRHTSHVCSAPV